MSIKQFQTLRLATAMFIAITVSISITVNNYLAPVVAIAIGLALLTWARHKVQGVIADERDYSLAGQAARYSLTIFTSLLMLGVFGFLAFKDQNPDFINISTLFAYLACALMIINSLAFHFLKVRIADEKENPAKRLKHYLPYFLLAFILALILITASLRMLSPEDDWICKDGAWIRHGNPSAVMPTGVCR